MSRFISLTSILTLIAITSLGACADDSETAKCGDGLVLGAETCDDGNACTIDDSCLEGVCDGDLNPSCQCLEDADCAEFEDGDLCNGTLRCVANSCELDEATVAQSAFWSSSGLSCSCIDTWKAGTASSRSFLPLERKPCEGVKKPNCWAGTGTARSMVKNC